MELREEGVYVSLDECIGWLGLGKCLEEQLKNISEKDISLNGRRAGWLKRLLLLLLVA